MEERQVYISFESAEYKFYKASILNCRAEVVQLQKRLVNLHALRSHKKRLLANLASLISSGDYVVERLDERMPDPSLPPGLKSKLSKKVKQKVVILKPLKEKEIKQEDFDVSDLDRELMDLNRRIKELG